MPYNSNSQDALQGVIRFLTGAAFTALVGGVMKNVGVVPSEHLGKGITGASTYAMGFKLGILNDLVNQTDKLKLMEAANKLNITYPEAVEIRRTAKELKDLVELDSDGFYKRYDKRFTDPRKLAAHYNISVDIADKLLDKRHWSLKNAESIVMHFLIPTAAAGAVGWFLPIPAAWVSAYPTASALLEGVAGFITGEAVRGSYISARRAGLFSGPCASEGGYQPIAGTEESAPDRAAP